MLSIWFSRSENLFFTVGSRSCFEDLKYEVLETNVPSKAAALVSEAVWSARLIMREPDVTRGGPWSSPKPFSSSQLKLIAEVAKVRSTSVLAEIAKSDQRCALYRHLCDLSFSVEESDQTDLYRGVHLRMSPRSGTRGNLCRKRRVDEGSLVQGSSDHRRSHRGKYPKKRRAQEYDNRKLREDCS